MAAYAALLSLAQTTHPNTCQEYESLFSSGAAEKVRSIHDNVSSLLWFFQKFPEKVSHWEARINDVAYEIDTIIQTFMLQQIQSCEGVMNPSLEDQLEDVMKRLDLIAGEVTGELPANLPASSSSSILVGRDTVIDRPAKASSSSTPTTDSNDAVIHLHEDLIMTIKDELCRGPSDLKVISIAGMGGIGKTTLAKTLYNDQLVIENFDAHACTVASEDYSPLRLWRNLVGSMTVSGKQMVVNENDEASLKQKVYETLMHKKYIIVLDDVWETQVWDDVRNFFPDNNNGSRIILTTRELDIAVHPHSDGPVHEMECLNKSQSWDLLRKKVFTNGCCPQELEEVGKRIARRCRGLPLAIVLVAGVLSEKMSLDSWGKIAEDEISNVHGNLEAILSLSYTNLPHHLRSCFLLIGGFQRDLYIRASKLTRLWAAEGFEMMEERCLKSFEEKAEEYLEELVKRNLVVVSARKNDGTIKCCGLHDLVRELCVRKAREEKFLRVMDKGDFTQVSINEPRVSFHCDNAGTILSPTLRTILCVEIQSGPSCLRTLGEYKLLKELDASGVNLTELPSQVFELYHLRYLAFLGSFRIPSDISNLVNLQTLIIHSLFGNQWGKYAGVVPHLLPFEIWMLPQLRHLLFHAPYVLPHAPLGSQDPPLQCLQTLLIVDLVWNVMILRFIPNVKRLGLTYTSNKEHNLDHLVSLHQLEKLEVTGFRDFSRNGRSLCFPRSLKKLTLVGVGFPWSDMYIVGSLPNLQVLKLLDDACDGEKWEVADEGFPSLAFLLIDKSNLWEWEVERCSFPTLKCLVLRSCPFLEKIPQDIGDISTLELIEVDYCKQSLLESAREIKEDHENSGDNALQVRIGHEHVNNLRSRIDIGEIDIVLNTLNDLLTYHADLNSEVRGDIEILQMDLDYFKAFLTDIENIRRRNKVIKAMVEGIYEVVYEVEYFIEVFVIKSVEKRNRDSFSGFWRSIQSMGKMVENRKWMINQCRQKYGIFGHNDEYKHENPEVRLPRKKYVVGFKDVTEDLISRLMEETNYFDVISITGMLGLGKTTVAWKIFNDERIVYKFPTRIWLPISQQFTDRDIFLHILKESTINNDIRSKSDHDLRDLVRAYLEHGSFLIVMDDVWSTADWDRLCAALPDHNMKGKVLITSREEKVGTYASSPRSPYSLRFFTFKESWELFQLEALFKLDYPPELEDHGREIARKCDGLPLAIVIIGEMLATMFFRKNATQMKNICEEVSPRVSWYLNQNDQAKRMQKFISLSYDQLPYHLRRCFLYLGSFPEDYKIRVSRLVRMWVAEGFVQKEGDSTLEETAEKYLKDLIQRNLVKTDKFKGYGKVKTCWIHNTLLDFCHSEAAYTNFLQEIKFNHGYFVPPTSNLTPYRRLFVHSNCSQFISYKPSGPHVRSFVCFPKDKYVMSGADSRIIIEAFEFLRVMDVLSFQFTAFDIGWHELTYLKYIALSSNLSVLHSGFNNLRSIQTLIVDTTSCMLQVEADIWQMKCLRHFKTNASATLHKSTKCGNDHHNAELQTLGSISVESCTEELSSRAPNLKKLGIRGKLDLLFNTRNGSFDSLEKMKKLGKLKLINDVYPEEGGLSCLPEPHRFPSSLTSLTLCATFLSWDHMSTLGLLEKLKVLKLKDHAFMGETWESVDGGFQTLEALHIDGTDLAVWIASSQHYPKLRGLVLKNCEKLLRIPLQLADIETLQMLELHTCFSAAESARQISDVKSKAGDSEFQLSIYPPNE